MKKEKQTIVVCGILGCYILFTVQSPSLLRAFFFFVLVSINKRYHLNFTSLQLFILLVSLFLLFHPFYLYDIGFLYSFVISFYMVCFQKLIKQRHRMMRLSLVAYVASIPITLATTFELNLTAFVFNFILTPFLTLLFLPCCFISFFIPFFEPFFELLVNILENVLAWMRMNGSWTISFCFVSLFFYLGYYFLLFLALKGFERKRKIYFYLGLMMLLIHYMLPYMDNQAHIIFLDVGQGDSALMTLPHHRGAILIDTGGSTNQKRCSQQLIPYIKSRGLKTLDLLILSHGDLDHAGDAACIMEQMKVKKIVLNPGPFNKLEQEILTLAKNKHISFTQVEREQWMFHGISLYFLNQKTGEEENDNSIILYTKIKQVNILFMGDATKKNEKQLLFEYSLPQMDILKVGHHGSNTSTSIDFIRTIQPTYSIISVGAKNRYGHPTKETLINLSSSHVLKTSDMGNITIDIGSNLNITTRFKSFFRPLDV